KTSARANREQRSVCSFLTPPAWDFLCSRVCWSVAWLSCGRATRGRSAPRRCAAGCRGCNWCDGVLGPWSGLPLPAEGLGKTLLLEYCLFVLHGHITVHFSCHHKRRCSMKVFHYGLAMVLTAALASPALPRRFHVCIDPAQQFVVAEADRKTRHS